MPDSISAHGDTMIVDMIRRFSQERLAPLAAERERLKRIEPEIIAELGELGVFGATWHAVSWSWIGGFRRCGEASPSYLSSMEDARPRRRRDRVSEALSGSSISLSPPRTRDKARQAACGGVRGCRVPRFPLTINEVRRHAGVSPTRRFHRFPPHGAC